MWIKKELFEEWSIGIYKMIYEKEGFKLFDYKTVKNPALTAKNLKDKKVRYVADPFIVSKNGTYYIFFEVLRNEKGIIGLAVSKDCRKWEYKMTVLEEPFHLSYPFIVNWGGEYYMLPESYGTNSVRLYKALEFPFKWEFLKTLLENKDFADPTILLYQDKLWLFVSNASSVNLYLYYADTLEGPWKEHPKSPIIKNDPTKARPAGNTICIGNRLIRIAQNDYPYYGNSIRAFEITKLNTQEYCEKELAESPLLKASGQGWNKDGMHHLSVCRLGENEWIVAVDGKSMNKRYRFA
jgi:hypothetical protein